MLSFQTLLVIYILLIYYLTGEILETISRNFFTDICQHAWFVYTVRYKDQAIHVYDASTWKCIHTFAACPSDGIYFHTLRVTGVGIALACRNNHCIHVLDYCGALQRSHGETAIAYFHNPRMFSMESNGSMLVADQFNDRLQLFHDDEWRVLQLQPSPTEPMGAVVTEHVLFVVSRGNKLIMYKIN